MLSVDPSKLSVPALRAEFGKNPKEYYSTELFEEKGFKRQRCKICGMYFWSMQEKDNCGDSAHTPYGFFREKPRTISYSAFWEKFSDFFRSRGHKIIGRYPVVSRWRPDLYFTIAGIQDFQRIENGVMNFEYSANPLLVPQPCLRFNDIENVGVTGGHFTAFMMANQTAFNYPKEGYWRDRTIALNFELLTKLLGVAEEDVIYHEEVWSMPDFSGFGPSIEAFPRGLEIVNNVFTQFGMSKGKVAELNSKVVDVGWSFEKNLWYYTGYSNAYEAVFRETLDKIRDELRVDQDQELLARVYKYGGALNRDEVKNLSESERKVLQSAKLTHEEYRKRVMPMQAAYALLDHTRTLLFAVSDGSLPSNVGGGYNLRLLLRRSFDFIDQYGFALDIKTLGDLVAREFKRMYPELSEKTDIFAKVVDVESDRYRHSRESAKRAVELLLEKGGALTEKQVRTLYESNGATPELIEKVAAEKKVKLELPERTYTDMVKGDLVEKEKQKELGIALPKGLPATKGLYYDFTVRAKAKVLFAKGKHLVLDRTPFYPEGGGQAADTGTVNGIRVVDVQKLGDHIVHFTEKDSRLKKGAAVEAVVDGERRNAIIAHHTATHLISAAARKVLGEHAWQEGAKKEAHKAHIDIAHYEKLSERDVMAIEGTVNAWLFGGIKVSADELTRGQAEGRYGFAIYQGHGVPAKRMRIITIRDREGNLIDAEACGGIHAVGRESLLGIVSITGTSRISDGIDRIEFVAGPAALKRFEAMHSQIDSMSKSLNVGADALPARVEELQKELAEMRKAGAKGSEALVTSIAAAIQDEELVEKELDVDRKMLIKIADLLVKRNESSTVLLRNREGNVVCMSGVSAKRSAVDFMNAKLKGIRFNGGGSMKFAEARIQA